MRGKGACVRVVGCVGLRSESTRFIYVFYLSTDLVDFLRLPKRPPPPLLRPPPKPPRRRPGKGSGRGGMMDCYISLFFLGLCGFGEG